MNFLFKALQFAAIKHKNQIRKGTGEPYINHPIELLAILDSCGLKNEDVLCIAILHDVLEDTQTSINELSLLFNDNIVNGVIQMSDNKTLPKSERKLLQIQHSKDLPYKVQLVKIADKISNIRNISNNSPKDWDIERTISFVLWCKAVVDSISNCDHKLYELFINTYTIEMSRLLPNYMCLTSKELNELMDFQLSRIDLKNEID